MSPFLVLDIASRIADRLIKSPSVPVEAPAKSVVKVEVAKELRPVLEHLTNNEPWYRSNVTWGALFAIMGGLSTIGTHLVLGTPFTLEAYGPPAGAIWGGAQALYGRWAARKPIGA
jgi:hypothetical protein